MGDDCSVVGGRIGFHIHRLPPLAGIRVRIGPARLRCEYRRALSSTDGATVFTFPRAAAVTPAIETTIAERTRAGRIPFSVTVAFRCVPSRLCECFNTTCVIAVADARHHRYRSLW